MKVLEGLLNDIKKAIDNSNNNTLYKNKSSRYYSDFLDKLNLITESSILNSNKKLNSLKLKLQLTEKYSQFTYYQGISEIMLWIFCLENNLNFAVEKKISSDNKKDVDAQILNQGYTFNIEVKCPEFQVIEDDTLNIVNGFRTVPKEQADSAMNDIKNLILENKQNKNTPYTNIKTSKMYDNKLVDYLKSGQEKFSDTLDNTLNIVMVGVRSGDLQDYWQYLYNDYSGLFTNSSFCCKDEYSKVDAVLLTNVIEGHDKPS
jgi:hypothetical protein